MGHARSCLAYYNLDAGDHSGGVQLFRTDGEQLELGKKWTCVDAGIYEVQLDASKKHVYGVDTKSRLWLVDLSGDLSATPSSFTVADPSASSAIEGTGLTVGHDSVCAVSMSGDLVVSDLSFRKRWSARAHEAEALCVNHFERDRLIATGSEDMSVKWWDERTGACELTLAKAHQAGVTCVTSAGEHLCMTGSYDDHLRLFDLRNPRRALLEQKTKGGVWDIMWRPSDALTGGNGLLTGESEALFLMPNCYAGLQVGRYRPGENSVRLESVTAAELCYAAGWFQHSVVYTFFYERQLRLVDRLPSMMSQACS